jgi:nucleotide-binding universal stress UspA family protein
MERILVPITCIAEMDAVEHVVRAFSAVDDHRITLLFLQNPEAAHKDYQKAEHACADWLGERRLAAEVQCRATASEARVETIVREGKKHDLLIMAGLRPGAVERFLFGSLSDDVAARSERPLIVVRT